MPIANPCFLLLVHMHKAVRNNLAIRPEGQDTGKNCPVKLTLFYFIILSYFTRILLDLDLLFKCFNDRFIVWSFMHIYLQVITNITYLAQTLLMNPRIDMTRYPGAHTSGTCSFDHAHIWPWENFESSIFGLFWRDRCLNLPKIVREIDFQQYFWAKTNSWLDMTTPTTDRGKKTSNFEILNFGQSWHAYRADPPNFGREIDCR